MADAPAEETPTPEESDGGSSSEEKTFTQADLDKIVQDRLARERQKFTDYEDLKAKASKLDELEQERKSEFEKLQERAEKAEAAMSQAEERARKALTRSAVISAAAGKVVDPDAAFRLLDPSSIVYDDDGTPSNIGDLIDSLVESKPYLAANHEPPPPTGDRPANQGGRGTKALTREDLKSMSPDQILEARDAGRLEHLFQSS